MRNGNIKIKKVLPQLKNLEVRQRGRMVRKMVEIQKKFTLKKNVEYNINYISNHNYTKETLLIT